MTIFKYLRWQYQHNKRFRLAARAVMLFTAIVAWGLGLAWAATTHGPQGVGVYLSVSIAAGIAYAIAWCWTDLER